MHNASNTLTDDRVSPANLLFRIGIEINGVCRAAQRLRHAVQRGFGKRHNPVVSIDTLGCNKRLGLGVLSPCNDQGRLVLANAATDRKTIGFADNCEHVQTPLRAPLRAVFTILARRV